MILKVFFIEFTSKKNINQTQNAYVLVDFGC